MLQLKFGIVRLYYYYQHSVQFSSVAQSCLTLCDPMNRSTPGLPVHHRLPEFTQTHVHRVSDAIQSSQNAGPTESAPLRTTRVPEPEWVRPGKCIQPGLASDSSRQSNLEPKQCRQGKHTCREQGKPSVVETLRAHTSVFCFLRPSLPTAQLNK